jgi:hypothetical protein
MENLTEKYQLIYKPTDRLYESTGVFRYEGSARLVVETDQGLSDFYRSLIPPWLPCMKPRWPAHITVVREEKEAPVNKEHWGKYDGQEIKFLYDPIVREGKVYYWLNIFCEKLEEIRLELGLPVVSEYTLPPEGFRKCFHMTIANKKTNG